MTPLVCRALGRLVEGLSCTACSAQDGSEGLARVAQETPDIILLDLVMPIMNGLHFSRSYVRPHPDLPVVIVRATRMASWCTRQRSNAPLMVVSKPFEADQIKRTIQAVVAVKAYARSTG